MTIDINELRRLTQAATPGHWQFWHGWVAADIDNDGGVIIVERPTPSGGKHQARVDNNFKFIAAANPATINELLDRLEAAESECLEESRLNGMGSEREAALMAKLEAAEKEIAELRSSMKFRTSLIGRTEAERDALRAKIAEMEQQEPIGEMLEVSPHNYELRWYRPVPFGAKLYLSQKEKRND